MMMQHKGLVGTMIGGALNCEERIRLDKLQRLVSAARACGDDSPWFVLRCWTGREIDALQHLRKLGINGLVPQRKGPDYRRRGRIIAGQMMPVIFGYVLVQIDRSPEILAALDAVDHAIDLLGGCEFPKRLSSEEVRRFKDLAEAGTYDWSNAGQVFRKGEKVRIVDGPFASFPAVIVTARPDGRGDAVVEIDIFGRSTVANLPLAFLEKI